jgi:hypothetical protein
MEKVYNVIYSGTFYGEARITAHSEEEPDWEEDEEDL